MLDSDEHAKDLIAASSQPLTKLRPPRRPETPLTAIATALGWPTRNDQSFAAGDTRVEQIALQHEVVLRRDRDHDSRVFRAVTLMDRRGVSRR